VLIDAGELDSTAARKADICVIGAGAAGITLARELAGGERSVCVLESGGLALEFDSQQLNRGSIGALPYAPLETARLRYFGGTTNHWSGWCRPLEHSDFERRAWVRDSGWPFGRAELDPFYERAYEIVRAGPGADRVAGSADPDAVGLPLRNSDVENIVFWLSPPARFGALYRDELASARNVQVLLHATVTRLVTAQDGASIERLEVAGPGGKRFTVRARAYVLAAGGIENPRLLLASQPAHGAAPGNAHDLVGRYFMDHAGIPIGTALLLANEPALRFYHRHGQTISGAATTHAAAIGAIRIADRATRREHMLNSSALLEDTDRSEAFGLRGLGGESDEPFGKTARNVLGNVDDAIGDAWRRVFRPNEPGRLVRIVSILEPSPNRASRVLLTPERDALGVPRIRLEWRLNADDRRSAVATLQLLSRALGARQAGRVLITLDEESKAWPPLPDGRIDHGWHHMGTTRMHDDPRFGVVDRDCRVHGSSNLYIAGSSVFPTYGFAQPTLTIVALALRLAKHLAGSTA
jgi:choline dehydrogenase-like flavoprotein